MPKLITRKDLVEKLALRFQSEEVSDEKIAWLASAWLGGHYRVVGEGVYEVKGQCKETKNGI